MEPHALRRAVEAYDLDAVRSTLSDDVIFHSPVIHDPAFEGRGSVEELFSIIFREIKGIRVTNEAADGNTGIFLSTATVLDEPLKAAWVFEHDDDGKVREIWTMIRPLRANVRIVYAVGTNLARIRGGTALKATIGGGVRGLIGYADTIAAIGSRLIAHLNRIRAHSR